MREAMENYGQTSLRSCVEVEVAVLGFPPSYATSVMVSVDVKQH